MLYFQVNIIIVEKVSRSETQPEMETVRSFYINSLGKNKRPQRLGLHQGHVTSKLHLILFVSAFFDQMKTLSLRRISEKKREPLRKSLRQTILEQTNSRLSNSGTCKECLSRPKVSS